MSPNKVPQPWWKLSRWTIIVLALFVSFYGAVLIPIYCQNTFRSRIFVYDANSNPVPYARLRFPTARYLPDYFTVTDAKGESHDPIVMRFVEKVSGPYTFHRTFWNSKAPKMWILSTRGTQTFTVKDETGKTVPELPIFLTFPPPRLYRSLHHAGHPSDALNNREFRTDRNGILAFRGVALSQRLQPHVEGTRFGPAKYVVQSVRVTTGRDWVNYDVRVSRPASVTGVLYSATGDPVIAAKVFAVNVSDYRYKSEHYFHPAAWTDSVGRFHLTQLSAGDYLFYQGKPQVDSPSVLLTAPKCRVRSGETKQITLRVP